MARFDRASVLIFSSALLLGTPCVHISAAQTARVGMLTTKPDLPPPLKGTIICRGGPELLWEAPVEMTDLNKAPSMAKRRVIGLIFQKSPGPAGPQGLGLKEPSQCGFVDKPWPVEYSPPRIYVEEASAVFETSSGGSRVLSRRSSIQEYLSDINHFWSFEVQLKSFYFEATTHRLLDAMSGSAMQVPILTKAGSAPGNVAAKAIPKQASAGQPPSGSASAPGTAQPIPPSTPVQSAVTVIRAPAQQRAEPKPEPKTQSPEQTADKVLPNPIDKAGLNPQPLPPKDIPLESGSRTRPSPAEKAGLNPQPLPPKDAPLQTGEKVLPNRVEKVGLNPQPLPPKDANPPADSITPEQIEKGLDTPPVANAVLKPAQKVDLGIRPSTNVKPGATIVGSSAADRAGKLTSVPFTSVRPNFPTPGSVELRFNGPPNAEPRVMIVKGPLAQQPGGARSWAGSALHMRAMSQSAPIPSGVVEFVASSVSNLIASGEPLQIEPGTQYHYFIHDASPRASACYQEGTFTTPSDPTAPSATTASAAGAAAAASMANLLEADDRATIIVGGKKTTAGDIKREIDAEFQRSAAPPQRFAVTPRPLPANLPTTTTPLVDAPGRAAGPLQSNQGLAVDNPAAALKMDCARNWPRISNIQGHVTPGSPFTINGTCFGNESGSIEIIGGQLQADFHDWKDTAIVAVIRAPVSGIPDRPIAISVRRTGDRKQSVAKEAGFVATRERIEVPAHFWQPSPRFTRRAVMERGWRVTEGYTRRSVEGQDLAVFQLRVDPSCTLDVMDAVATQGAVQSITGWDVGAPHEASVRIYWQPRCIINRFNYGFGYDREEICTVDFTLRAWASCPAGLKP